MIKKSTSFSSQGTLAFDSGLKVAQVKQVTQGTIVVFNSTMAGSKIGNKSSKDKTSKGALKEAKLPTKGKIRYVPPMLPKKWMSQKSLLKKNGGCIDKFVNVQTKGPPKTKGQFFEWDVQLFKTGKRRLG